MTDEEIVYYLNKIRKSITLNCVTNGVYYGNDNKVLALEEAIKIVKDKSKIREIKIGKYNYKIHPITKKIFCSEEK